MYERLDDEFWELLHTVAQKIFVDARNEDELPEDVRQDRIFHRSVYEYFDRSHLVRERRGVKRRRPRRSRRLSHAV